MCPFDIKFRFRVNSYIIVLVFKLPYMYTSVGAISMVAMVINSSSGLTDAGMAHSEVDGFWQWDDKDIDDVFYFERRTFVMCLKINGLPYPTLLFGPKSIFKARHLHQSHIYITDQNKLSVNNICITCLCYIFLLWINICSSSCSLTHNDFQVP